MYNNIYIHIMDNAVSAAAAAAAQNNEKKIGFVYTHTHTHTVYYALTYIIMWRAEPVRLVRDRVEDRSSATTDCGRSDGGVAAL